MESREKIWDECLNIWKTISEMPDQHVESGMTTFKQNVAQALGYPSNRLSGCPLCAKFKRDILDEGEGMDEKKGQHCCTLCPISADQHNIIYACEHNTPYGLWVHAFPDHRQKCAKMFFEYLKDLRKSENNNCNGCIFLSLIHI